MITKTVKKSSAFGEFSSEAQKEWFDLTRDKVCSHIDTLYYTVSVFNDSNENPLTAHLIQDIMELRKQKSLNPSALVQFPIKERGKSYDLEVTLRRYPPYEYCLSFNENFDIFFLSSIINEETDTPRIAVQLRTRSLVLDGTMRAVCKSFAYVEKILKKYGLFVGQVKINRCDFAYHTNIIQNPYNYFSDEYIANSLRSSLRIYQKVGKIHGGKIDVDYFSLGQKGSRNVFLRVYNKSQEVIEKNYKFFFIQRWLDLGLISKYDYYVYGKAYEYKSYRTGMLLGRLDWYLEYGKNENIKAELLACRKSCYLKSDNVDQIEKVVKKYLPPVTLIMNIEFQTMRKFYHDISEWLSMYGIVSKDMYSFDKLGFVSRDLMPLWQIHNVYSLRSEIQNYLTSSAVAFVDNKGTKKEKFSYWWKRINEVYIEEYEKKVLDLYRTRENSFDVEKSKRRLYSSLAHFYMTKNQSLNDESDFTEDVVDVLCSLNDNDFYGFAPNPATGEIPEINLPEYQRIKERKARQLKGIIKEE